MIKLKSLAYSRGEYAGRTIQLPVVGEVAFEKDGTLEVKDEKTAFDLIEATKESFDFEQVGKPKELTPEEQDVREYKELLDLATEQDILTFVSELGEEHKAFKEKAAAMSNDKLKKELLKIYKKQKETEK
jgi:hypothetical protein